MNVAGAMRSCMVSLDTVTARELWRKQFSHLAQPKTDAEMLQMLHLARTQSAFLPNRLRFYSHCWLLERGLPTMLPDELRPAADRMYPRKQTAVGISVNSSSELLKPILPHVRNAMETAVSELYADGKSEDIPLIKSRMFEARTTVVRKLLGRIVK